LRGRRGQRKQFWRRREIAAGGHHFAEGGVVKRDISALVFVI
jgi:hypothetical protein